MLNTSRAMQQPAMKYQALCFDWKNAIGDVVWNSHCELQQAMK